MRKAGIQVQNISFRYPKGMLLFQEFSCFFAQGKAYGIIGKNGSGKTTLGKLILNLLKLEKGSIRINGNNIAHMTLGEIGEVVGYVYQNPEKQLFAATVYEELSFPLLLSGASEEEVKDKVEAQLVRFDLKGLEEAFPFYLSPGEKQRLVLAGMLLRTRDFIILDEPTTSLDSVRKAELKNILLELKHKEGMGLIIISHDMDFLAELDCELLEIKSRR